jgi:hypothetical protein
MVAKSNRFNKSRRSSARKQKSVAYIHHQSALLSYLVTPAQEGGSPASCFHFS